MDYPCALLRPAALILTACLAMLSDIRTGRIPNRFLLCSFAAAFLLQVLPSGMAGALRFLGGTAPALLFLAPLFRFRMIGAGDIKLLGVLGAYLDLRGSLLLLAVSVFCGAAAALFRMLRLGMLRERFRYFFRYVRLLSAGGPAVPYRLPGRRPEHICFSVPVFAASLLAVFLPRLS